MMLVRWIALGSAAVSLVPISQSIQRAAAQFTTQVFTSALAVHTKAEEVSRLWPILLADLVHQTFQEYRSIDEQMAALLDKL